MDDKAQVREFLTTRRAKLSPAQVGLPADGVRRVPGLRRGEVASLAGVSIEYYARIERGDLSGVSESVFEAIARALQLDAAEREHLYHLAALFNGSPALRRSHRRAAKAWAPSEGLQRILDLMPDAPAVIYNGRGDVLATNHLGRALYAPVFASQPGLPNFNRYCGSEAGRAVERHLTSGTSARMRSPEMRMDPHDEGPFALAAGRVPCSAT